MKLMRVVALIALVAVVGIASIAAVPAPSKKRVAVVAGYPAPDAPIFEFVFRQRHIKVEMFDKQWVPPETWSKYNVVVLHGSLSRGKVEPSSFTADDLMKVQTFFDDGGTLLLTASGMDAFRTPDGRKFLDGIIGKIPPGRHEKAASKLLAPSDAWVKHLANQDLAWLSERSLPVFTDKGESLIGTGDGRATLGRFPAGKGQIIYVGWNFSDFIPHGRDLKSTLDQETQNEQQYQILANIAASLVPVTE